MKLRYSVAAVVLGAIVVVIGALAVYWHIFPPPGIAGNTIGISGPALPWVIEYSFADGNYSRSERAFSTKYECDAAIDRVLKETPAGVEFRSAHCIHVVWDLPKMVVGVPTAPAAPSWTVEFIGMMGQWDRTGAYASKAACEAAIATLPKGAGGDGHCVYHDSRNNLVIGSQDPAWPGFKGPGCATPQCVNERCPPLSHATLYGPEWKRLEAQEKSRKCQLLQGPMLFLQGARAIVLVHVEELTPPPGPSSSATLRVIKSWKGPYSAGRILHVEAPVIVSCPQFDCTPYVFQPTDKELLITRLSDEVEPVHELGQSAPNRVVAVWQGWTWPAAESQALMDALDQATCRIALPCPE